MRKVLIIGDAASPHLSRWVVLLHSRGYSLAVFSFRKPAAEIASLKGVIFRTVETLPSTFSSSLISKFSYLRAMPALRRFAREFCPDIVHAHYASSYGLLAARLNLHPLVLSVWGSDVFAFGERLPGRMILRYNFSRTDLILSTSEVMKQRIAEFTSKDVTVTPFGIDTDLFYPGEEDCPYFKDADCVFGMVKTMENIYGVDLVLRAFKKVMGVFPDKKLRLLLVGGGSDFDAYKHMADEFGLNDFVHFTGRIPQDDVPRHHRMIDIFLNPSRQESFGVSVLEAMSCGKPVIVSDAGGLREIVVDGENGRYCKAGDADELADRMSELLSRPDLAGQLAMNARSWVMKNYNKKDSDERMIRVVYDPLFAKLKGDKG